MVNLKGEKLILCFTFDKDLVAAVRELPGRLYDNAAKHWEVPLEHIGDVMALAEKHHLRVHRDVALAAQERAKHAAKVEELKKTPALYEGRLPLYDFQKIGASFLMSMQGALLGDSPGLGKTIQTIAALERVNNVLILCPASLKYSWAQELEKWTDAYPNVIDGDKKKRTDDWHAGKEFFKYTIANYELLIHDEDIMPQEWEAIVCDEATRTSNPNAKSVKALKKLKAKKKIALTGTPISNTPVDLYSILDWLSPGVLGSYWHFLDMFCVREPRFHRIIGFKNLPKLAEITKGFMLRRTKEEVLTDFPPKIIQDIVFNLSAEERDLYDDIRMHIVEKLGDIGKNLGIIPVEMLRLKQCTGEPEVLGLPLGQRSSKRHALQTIIEPIVASGEKVIVFTQFAEIAKILHNEYGDSLLIYGDVPSMERQKIVDHFNAPTGQKILIMSEAGAFGLNLQAASYVVHFDLPWSIAKIEQREGRAHRIGQSKPVTVYNLIAKNTIDEYVARILAKKNKTSVDILGDFERLEDAGLTEDDIKAILRI